MFFTEKCDIQKSKLRTKILSLFIICIFELFPGPVHSQQYIGDILLAADPSFFSPYLAQENGYEIQLIYGEIDRNQEQPKITHHTYKLNSEYYYPASSVKLPIAVLAMEYLNHLGIDGLDMHSKMEHGAERNPQSTAVSDSSAQNLLPSLAHYARKIFLYSDNDAYNRLFELLGQSIINQRLQQLGIANTRLLHRVGIGGFDAEENKWINPISFYGQDEMLYYRGGAYRPYQSEFIPENQQRGQGFYRDGQLIKEPMDFSQKNYIPLSSLLSVLERVILPEAFPKEEQFDLTADQYQWLWKAMGQYPQESQYPDLSGKDDGYVKFFVNGGEGERINSHTRIFNKVGYAYGYLTDVAYIVDFESGAEFFVGAVIHVNKNRIFNDDTYEYDEIGLPFLKRVGQVLLEHNNKMSKNLHPAILKYKKAIEAN